MSLVHVDYSLAEVVLCGLAIVDSLEAEDVLIDVLGHFGSEWGRGYLRKPMNLARTHSLTCLARLGLEIFFCLGAATFSDIWFFN